MFVGLHLLIGLGVVALGRWWTRPTVPLARAMGRLRRLLWLSIGAKGALWGIRVAIGEIPDAPIAALGLLANGGQTLLEFAAILMRLFPREQAERGLTISQREYLSIRLRPVQDALTPLLAGGLAWLTAHYTLSGAYQQSGGWGVFCASAMGLTALLMTLGIHRSAAPLPVRTVSLVPSLFAEAKRLGDELGVQVREILVLDGTRTRTANAYALSGGRIALTDYLIAALSERELYAVLAHEIAHLAQRRRLVRIWMLLTSAGIATMLVSVPFWGRLPRWGLLALLCALAGGMFAPMLYLRRRHEREADAFAVSQYGVEPLESALRKLAQLNLRDTHRTGDALHPSLRERLHHIRRFQRHLTA